MLLAVLGSNARANEPLPGTKLLGWKEEDLSGRLMNAAHAFVEKKIAETTAKREQYWKYDSSSRDAYVASIAENRQELKTLLGVVDERLPARMERYGDDAAPTTVAETDRYRVLQVRWPVFDGVFGEGLHVQPKEKPVGYAVVVPDASVSPEQALGLAKGLDPSRQVARRLAENGFEVIVPQTLSRDKWQTDDARLVRADYTDREWIYRQAFHMGRHVIGYEIQRVLAAVDWLSEHREQGSRIGVAGYGEGGQIAFFAAAVDQRIDAAFISGYFALREKVWSEPIYRNVFSRLQRFGDAEVASLIAPRQLVIEHREFPSVSGHKGDIGTFAFLHKHLDWPEPKSDVAKIRDAITLYASFDERVAADFGGGQLDPRTRSDDPDAKGKYIMHHGYPKSAFAIDPRGGISGGALRATDVLPNRGRLYYPAAKNIGYRSDGWSGSASFWLKMNPDTMLKTPFCDPVQITQRRAGDGGLWIDFPDRSRVTCGLALSVRWLRARSLFPKRTPTHRSSSSPRSVSKRTTGITSG